MHDPKASLTEMFVQQQKAILQLTARVEALERLLRNRAVAQVQLVPLKIRRGPEVRARLAMAQICEKVAHAHDVRVEAMKGRDKARYLTAARKEFCRLALAEGFTSAQVGTFLGGRDHTSILYLARAGEKEAA